MKLLQFLPHRLPGVTTFARAKVAIPNRPAPLPLVAAALVVLTLAAAAFFLVRPASAEDIWSATLNVKKISTGIPGCQTPHDISTIQCSDSSTLSDDDFIVNTVTYDVTLLRLYDDEFLFRVNPAPAGTDLDALEIHLGTTAFAFADATSTTHSAGISYKWPTTLSWSVGDSLNVRITLPPPDPPKNLNARADAPIRVKLNWSPVRGSSGYKIEWSADGSDPWALLYDWPPNYGVHTADNTITPGTTRHYRVRGVNAAGIGPPSNVVSATTPTLVDSDGGAFNFGAVRSEFESLRDQKVFQYNFEAGEKYLFTIRGRAFKHRVIVTGPGGAEIENFALAGHHFDPRITAIQTGLHQVKISHGGAVGLTAGDDHSLAAGWFTFHLVPATDEEDITLRLTGDASSTKAAAVLNTWLDVDRFNIVVQTGKAYTVRVIGHERTNGEASTPWISRAQFPLSNGGYSEKNMALPWVEGQTKRVKRPITAPETNVANSYEYQAFVIDLRGHGQHGAEKTWRIYVTSTERPGTYPYDLGGYEVELEQLNPRNISLPLRAWFVSPPEQHDGKKRVKVQVEFTETIEESPENVGEHGVQVEGGRVTSVRQVENQPAGGAAGRSSDGQEDGPEDGEQVWEFEIEPDSDDDLTIRIDGGDSCDEPGAICTADGRSLYKGISTTVEGPKGPLTAAFERLPETHDGEEAAFPFRVAFSEHIQPLRHASFTVDGGEVTGTRRVDGRHDLWRITVEPDSDEDVTITLPGDRECGTAGAVCTSGNDPTPLMNSPSATVAWDSNTAATGTPAISGTPQVGETLTVDTSGIADEDGLENVSYSYRWLAKEGTTETHITGGTDSTHTLADAVEGKAIKVQVTFTDDAGNWERLTSAATDTVSAATQPNSPATGAPMIRGTVQIGETLTADTSSIADTDGLTNVSYSYQWLADDTAIQGATNSTYTLADADEGKAIGVRVSFTDDAGNEESLIGVDAAAWSAAMTVEWVYRGYGYYSTDVKEAGLLSPASFNVDGTAYTVKMVETQGWWMYIGVDRELPFDFVLELDGERFASGDASFNSYSYGNIYRWEGTGLSWRDGDTVEVRLLRAFEDETAVNSAATGAPAIGGTAQVGETLTADTSGIEDADGLDNAAFTYQWLAGDTEIQGATNADYTLVEADEGKAVKVQVSFTDDVGNPESLTSVATDAVVAATPENNPATGAPSINGTAQVGETLTADTSGISDADGLTSVSYIYQWLADDADISGATGSTCKLADVDEGKAVKVQVSFTDDGGNDETLTSTATATVEAPPNNPATGAPIISGTIQVGETLTADTSGIEDADGLTSVSYSHQWLADDADISGATSSTYTLVEADEGLIIQVWVSFTDDAGNYETRTSDGTDAVAPKPNSPTTGAPTISGTVQVGETLTADTSGIADADGLANAAFTYQWIAGGMDIAGETVAAYTLTEEDQGMAIQVWVTFTDDAGNEESLTSAATPAVAARPNNLATGAPTISGTAQVGETLTVDTSGISDDDGLANVSYSYQWIRNDGSTDFDIVGQTASTYTLVSADAGKTVKARVSFTDDADNNETLTSSATGAVAPPPNSLATGAPTISGIPQVGKTLTAHMSGITDEDGLTKVSYSYQWLADDADIQGATNSTYTLAEIDEGKAIKVRVSFTDDAGHDETLTCEATAAVSAAPPPPPKNLRAVEEEGEVKLTWEAPDDATVTGYRIDRRRAGEGRGADHTLVEDTGSSETGYTDQSAEKGVEYEYRVSARNEDGAGEASGWVSAAPDEETLAGEDAAAWSAIMTVEWVYQGYGYYSTGTKKAGSLSPASFNVDGTTYTVKMVETQGWWTYIGVDRELPFDFVLELDGTRFASGDASFNSYSYGNIYRWEGTGLSLSDGDTVEVRLLHAVEDETAVNSPATGAPIISGTVQVGETLTADTSGIEDADGLDNADFAYQWLADDTEIQGATNSTYTLVEADEGKTISVQVSFTDNAGNPEANTSAPTDVVQPPATSPAITGTARVGETLTVDTSPVSDTDGLEDAVFGYQWIAGGADIEGATGASYTIIAEDEGLIIQVWVSFTDDAGNYETRTSDGTDAVAPKPNYEPTGQPTIRGTAQVEETLTADTSGIADENGLENVTFSYQWPAGDDAIAGATDSTYTLADADEDKTVKVQVSFTDDAGNAESLTSAATDAVSAAPQPNNEATGAPTIRGTAQVGETLKADTSDIADEDGLENATFAYQWQADDADIPGATESTYTLSEAIEGKAISVQVSFNDDAGNAESLTSAGTAAVAAATQPNIPATKAYITVVIASGDDTVSWSDPDGCSSDYNIYKAITPSGNDSETSHIHLGSAASGSTRATLDISHREDDRYPAVEVELYCGTYDAASSQDLLISSARLSIGGTSLVGINIREGTYSSAPLTALTISSGTLSPDFDRGGLGLYSAEVPNDVEVITLDPTVLTGYQTDLVKNPGLYTVTICGRPPRLNCLYTYGDGTTTGIVLSDADTDTEGFQINLDRGENRLGIGVHKGPVAGGSARTYYLTVTRAANTPATGQPTISGTAQVGQTLTADTWGIADADGLTNADFTYQWLSSRDTEIGGATSSTYTLQASDEGKIIKVRVTFTDDAGNDETLTSGATDAVVAPEPPDRPTGLSGDVSHDSVTLTWDDPHDDTINGYVILRRNIARQDPGEFTTVEENTGSADTAYTDAGVAPETRYAYRIKAINAHGTSSRSGYVNVDTAPAPTPTPEEAGEPPAAPTGLSATASHDSVLLTWDDPDDDSITGYIVLRRNRANTAEGEFTELVGDTGAAATTYTDDSIVAETPYTYRIKAINEHGLSERSRWFHIDTPAAPVPTPEPANSAATGAPTISGTAQVGETLTASTSDIDDDDGLTNATFSYQWLSSRDTEIQGFTDSTYTLTDTDADKTIKVRVTFTDDAGNEETLTSTPTTAVAKAKPGTDEVEVQELELFFYYSCALLNPDDYEIPEGEDPGCSANYRVDVAGKLYGAVLDDDEATLDYVLRFDLKDSEGNDADACEQNGMGVDVEWRTVDTPEIGLNGPQIYGCEAGNYTLIFSARQGSVQEWQTAEGSLILR